MIVPQFWAEGRVSRREKGRQVTVRRFGWSDTNPADAQARADARAEEAFARVWRGEKLARTEPRRAYNGAEGVPIREEIVERHGETIITRNGYGARCLNSANVLFADVDFEEHTFGAWLRRTFGGVLKGLVPALGRDAQSRARERTLRFVGAHPGWILRAYRTPAGLRLLAMHRTFAPSDPEVADFFTAVGADRVYVRMCQRQQCFRARVSPKPWRIGLAEHIRPARGVWPPRPEQVAGRERWIDAYERAARGFAACRHVETFGTGHEDAQVVAVQRLHDDMCRAHRDLPLA